MAVLTRKYEVSGDDFSRAGEASGAIKRTLKGLGFEPEIVRRVAIATYEAEINMVIHASGGVITASISPESVTVEIADKGPGIPNIDLAMQEGWSTAPEIVREMGFGAGMGLPNIKKYSDYFDIKTELGVGTTLRIRVDVKKPQ
jgi:anti-sigma regulatory factor (Ser/Thr protein kinase)